MGQLLHSIFFPNREDREGRRLLTQLERYIASLPLENKKEPNKLPISGDVPVYRNRISYQQAIDWLEQVMGSSTVDTLSSFTELLEDEGVVQPPDLQVKQLKEELSMLPEPIFQEISYFVEALTDKKFSSISRVLDTHFENIRQYREQFFTVQDSRELPDLVDNFLKEIDPGHLAMDLRVFWTFDDIEKQYHQVIDQLSSGHYGEILDNYRLSNELFAYLREGLAVELQDVVVHLEEYRKHYQKLKQEVQGYNQEEMQQLATAFLTLESGFYHSSANTWILLFAKVRSALQLLKDRLRFMLFMIYGGAVLEWTKALAAMGIEVSCFSLHDFTYEVVLSEEEERALVYEIERICEKIEIERDSELARRLHEFIGQHPLLEKVPFREGKSLRYWSQLYICLTRLIDIRLLQVENRFQFCQQYEEFYRELSFIVRDEDLRLHLAPTQFELLALYIHEHEQVGTSCEVVFDYIVRIVNRYEKNRLDGTEELAEWDSFCVLMTLLATYAREYGVIHPFIEWCELGQGEIPPAIIEDTLEMYKETIGTTDKFYKHFHSSFAMKLGSDMVRSIVNTFRR